MSDKLNTKKKGMKKPSTSAVWSYFKVCEEDPVQADCLLCNHRMSRGGSSPNRCGTTNLRRHILYSHKISLPIAKSKSSEVSNKSPKKLPKKYSVLKKNSLLKKNEVKQKKLVKTNELKKSPMLTKKNIEKDRTLNEEIEWLSSNPQPEPVMCIKWNTYLSNMTSTLPNLLQDEQFVDVTLSCEGQSLKCHKILLAACSPYFYELLSEAACRHPIIVFKDYRFWELQALVSFMYCGEVNVPQSQLPRILHVAEALQIKGLAKPASSNSGGDTLHEVESPPLSPYSSDLENMEPPVTESPKRKRKPSALNCCKNHPKTQSVKPKPKKSPPKSKTSQVSKKTTGSPSKKRKRSPPKAKKIVKAESEHKAAVSPSPSPENCPQLPELLASDIPDMLSDILTSNMMEGISLPEALTVGAVDGSLPLQHFDPGKMELDEEESPFLVNGLAHDLMPHINPECEDEEEGR